MFGSFISRGLKLKAYKRLSQLLVFIKNKERVEPRYILLITCMRTAPSVILKKLYRGSRVIIKPVPLTSSKQPGLVVKWFVKPLRDSNIRRNFSVKKMFDVLLSSLRRRGDVHKRKMDIYKAARLNRKPKVNMGRR